MIRIQQLKIKINHTEEQLRKKAAELLDLAPDKISDMEIVRQSVDARKKPEIYYIYTVLVTVAHEDRVLHRLEKPCYKKTVLRYGIEQAEKELYVFPKAGTQEQKYPTVIVGMGPAGLFCGYFLALHGYAPILLERGKRVEDRLLDVEHFWETGQLNLSSNVQFGEGGAGTFSDGKLNTLVKEKAGRSKKVLETFVKFGAKETIVYEAKPHIGTDALCGIVKKMREEIIRLGGQVFFESQATDVLIENGSVQGVVVNGERTIPCTQLVLAIGHSARDTFSMLYEKKLPMEAKSFAVGLRVQHCQNMINKSQYGTEDAGGLGAAPYKLAAKTSLSRGVYSFCMCPGGYVVNASSEEKCLAVNGMSYSGRDSAAANSAIIVSVSPKDFGSEHPLAGIAFQRKLEEKAYSLCDGKIPAQKYGVFKKCTEEDKTQEELLSAGELSEADIFGEASDMTPLCKGEYRFGDVSRILPRECNLAFVEGMEAFDRQIKGFNRPDTVLLGVESRTSSPVRIHRDETFQSEIKGIYPCGEGAGYAGGIMSAAIDGLRVAEAIAGAFLPAN